MEFKVGQKVYSLAHGWGEVMKIEDGANLCLWVDFPNEGVFYFTTDGRLVENGPISLFPYKPEIIAPKWQPKEGEWCYFWDFQDAKTLCVSRFTKMDGNKFVSGGSSIWSYCAPFTGELPEHLKNL